MVTGGPDPPLAVDLAPLQVDETGGCTAMSVTAGQVAHVALTYAQAGSLTVRRLHPPELKGMLEETISFWTLGPLGGLMWASPRRRGGQCPE